MGVKPLAEVKPVDRNPGAVVIAPLGEPTFGKVGAGAVPFPPVNGMAEDELVNGYGADVDSGEFSEECDVRVGFDIRFEGLRVGPGPKVEFDMG